MITKKWVNMFAPVKGARPQSKFKQSNLHSSPNYKDMCEVELCCNCPEEYCNGEPCEKLKQAYKQRGKGVK